MSGLRLYQNEVSPYARKVRVALIETGQQDDVELVKIAGSPVAPDPSGKNPNPIGKIPALERPDGPTLIDSRVICRFLNARAGAALYPEARIWEVLTLEALADGLLDAAVIMVYEKRCRPEAGWSTDWLEAQWGKVEGALDALEGRWLSHLAGPLDMGQLAAGVALAYLDLRHPERDWRRGRDGLVTWERSFAQRPSMLATKPA